MSGEWKKVKLGDLVEINKSSIGRDFPFDEIEYIDTSSVTQNNFEKPQILSLLTAPSRAKRLVKKNDIIISTVRPIQRHYGFMKDVKPNTVVSTGFAVVTGIKINSLFLFYFLTQDLVTEYLDKIAESSTTTFPAFRPEILSDLELDLPPLSTQQKIAEILSSLDDKIELNRQTNATLEAMAQTLFKEWFVAPITEEDKIRLSDVIDIKHGYAFKGEFFSETPTNDILVTPGNFKIGGGFNYSKFKYYNGEYPNSYILNKGEVIVTMTDLSKDGDSLGYAAITPQIISHNLLHNQRIGRIVFKNGYNMPFFISYLMRQSDYRNFVLGSATGTTVRHTSPNRICEFAFSLPNQGKIAEFEKIANELYELEIKNQQENQTLQHLRDSLLPRLMKGELLF